MSEHRERGPAGLMRSSAIVAVGTGLSRATGLLRIGALTYAIGATNLSDAYNLANTTPNIVYELVLGGVLSATLVPVFLDHLDEDDDGISAITTVAVSAMVALTVAAIFAAPFIMRLYTLRRPDGEAAALSSVGVPLMRMFIPQILFYGLTSLGTALLNAKRSFALPAYAPVLNNIVVSAVLIALPHVAGGKPSLGQVADDRGLLWLLGLGTTAGIAAMTVVLWPAIRRTGVRLRWHFDIHHPAVRAVARLSGWTVGYVAANQVALAVVQTLANRREGDVSAYQYAFVFFQLPYGLIAVSIMTTFSPDLASFAREGRFDAFRSRFRLGLRALASVILPSAAGYAVLAHPLVAALLQRGRFDERDAQITAEVLVTFAVGLFGFSVYLFALRGFYALKDTRTPFLINLAENGLNIVLAIALVGPLGVQGLGLAYAAAYTIAAVVAVRLLGARVGPLVDARTVRSVASVVVATAVMAGLVWLASRAVGSNAGGGAVVRSLVGVAVGAAVYAAVIAGLSAADGRRQPPD
jgi:putative peptidoglycan lipid II flippase